MPLDASLELIGGGTLTPATAPLSNASESIAIGSNGFESVGFRLTDGTGPGQATQWYSTQLTLTAGSGTTLDLAGGLSNSFGQTLTFQKIKLVVIAVIGADGSRRVRVGPRGQANAWIGPLSSGDAYLDVPQFLVWAHPLAGWPVTAGSADLLAIFNPGSTAVTSNIWIVGTT